MRFKYFIVVLLILSLSLTGFADTVKTKDGSILNGKITLIDKGVINIETSYAGKLKLKQENVVSFETSSPLEFRLQSGALLSGVVTSKSADTLSIQHEGETKEIITAQIAAGWTPDKIDPEIERSNRKWKNDFAVNLNGRTGNVERFNFGTKLNVRLKGPFDEVYFGFNYEQGEENGNKTADRILGQVSYEQFSKNKVGWFVRSVLDKDPLNGIYLRSTTSNGVSYRLINDDFQTLIFRGGLGYRFTKFEEDELDNESTLTLDPGLSHSYKFKDWFYLENEINYSPAVEDFKNYTAAQDSSIKIPVGNDENFWIRIGIKNEYRSQTSADENLDTNYYSQLIYSWK
jgi:hypothetical protein